MSDTVAKFLEHHGVKGMKWGVRKDRLGVGSLDMKVNRHDAVPVTLQSSPFQKRPDQDTLNAQHKDTFAVLHSIDSHLRTQASADTYNNEVARRLTSVKNPSSLKVKDMDAIMSESFSTTLTKHLEKAGASGITVKSYLSEDGHTFHYALGDKKTVDGYLRTIRKNRIAHADLDNAPLMTLTVEFLMNDDGTPNGFNVVESKISDSPLAHSIDEIISHFGIKGMKWGVRRTKQQLGYTSSGDASPDAIRAKEALTKIRKTGSVSSVSNADLEHLNKRLNLEKKFAEVNPKGVEKGHKAVQRLLALGTTMASVYAFYNSPFGKAVRNNVGPVRPYGRHSLLSTYPKHYKRVY